MVPDLGSLDDQITRVFDFKSGQVAFTKGVHMLDEPFLINFVGNGEQKKVRKRMQTFLRFILGTHAAV